MNRLLVFALLDDALSEIVRQHQTQLSCLSGNQLALKFPVHITLRGPFWANAEVPALRDCLQRACSSYRPVRVLLNGPVLVDPDLCWLEVIPTSTGFPSLLDLHMHFEDEMKRHVIIDDVPANHKGNNYRPHVTVGWGVDSAVQNTLPSSWKSSDFIGTLEKVAIAVYPEHWPSGGRVEVIEAFALGGVPSSHPK